MIYPVDISQCLSSATQCLSSDPVNSVAKVARSLCMGPKYGLPLTKAAQGFLAEAETSVDSLL